MGEGKKEKEEIENIPHYLNDNSFKRTV